MNADDCSSEDISKPMVIQSRAIKNWEDYEADGVDCGVVRIYIPKCGIISYEWRLAK